MTFVEENFRRRPNRKTAGLITTNMQKHTKATVAHIGAAIIFCTIGVSGSVKLIEMRLVGEQIFLGLVALTSLVSFLIAFMWKFKDFKVTGVSLEATLHEAKEIETSVKELAAAVLEVIASDTGSYRGPEWDSERFGRALKNLKRMVD
jgi:hypothetical protein